jgi:predicted dehydrogenase
MKGLIFGLGMIGRKHAEILNEKFHVQLYTFSSRSSAPFIKGNLSNWEEARELNPDFVLISNPTSQHLSTLDACLDLHCPVFLEKPVDLGAKKLQAVLDKAKSRNITVYVAYCLRFNPVVKYVKEYLKTNHPVLITIVNSNNLDCWPRKDGKSYSVNYDDGGGVILDMSHEIDYLHYAAGIKELVHHSAQRNSSITNDAADYLHAEFRTGRCLATVELNYHGHYPQRTMKIDFKDHTLFCDLKTHIIEVYKGLHLTDKVIFEDKYEEMYVKQWNYFFDNLKNEDLMNNLEDASAVFHYLVSMNHKY